MSDSREREAMDRRRVACVTFLVEFVRSDSPVDFRRLTRLLAACAVRQHLAETIRDFARTDLRPAGTESVDFTDAAGECPVVAGRSDPRRAP